MHASFLHTLKTILQKSVAREDFLLPLQGAWGVIKAHSVFSFSHSRFKMHFPCTCQQLQTTPALLFTHLSTCKLHFQLMHSSQCWGLVCTVLTRHPYPNTCTASFATSIAPCTHPVIPESSAPHSITAVFCHTHAAEPLSTTYRLRISWFTAATHAWLSFLRACKEANWFPRPLVWMGNILIP